MTTRSEARAEQERLFFDHAHGALRHARDRAAVRGGAPTDYVIVVADLRDELGFAGAKRIGKIAEADLQAHKARCLLGGTTPTCTFEVRRSIAETIFSVCGPELANQILAVTPDQIPVVVFSEGGASVFLLTEEIARTVGRDL